MRYSGRNLASQVGVIIITPTQQPRPNETQQTRTKPGLPIMQEELPVIITKKGAAN